MIVHGEELLVPAHLNFGKFILDRLRKAKPDDTCWGRVAGQGSTGADLPSWELEALVALFAQIHHPSGDKLSYGEFTQHAVSVGAALTALGVGRGDTVAVAGEPRAVFMPTAIAVVFTGAAYTPIELKCGRAILAHKLDLTKPKYFICSRLFWEAYKDILKGLDFIKTFICFDDIEDIKLSIATMASRHVDVTAFEPVAVYGDVDVAMVAYSSGTTGMSKGVLLTHLNCIAGASMTWYSESESLQTCLLSGELSSLHNVYMIFFFLSTGKRLIFTETFTDPNFTKTLQDYQVNTNTNVPSGLQRMVNAENVEQYDLSSLKIMYSTGDQLPPTLFVLFKKRYPHIKLLQLYGATEVGAVTVADSMPDNLSSTPTVGVAAPGVMIKVVDTRTRATLGPNQRGEICVRGPSVMKGYLGATSPYLDDEGFFLTGDFGYYDDNKQFYYVDRLKDIICFNGNKVAPKELETVLLGHPAVREAAVVGKPAEPEGELPAAFVVLQPGAQATETELINYVAKEVSSNMQLRGGLRFLSALPRSSRQKVLHRQLREMLEDEQPRHNAVKTQQI